MLDGTTNEIKTNDDRGDSWEPAELAPGAADFDPREFEEPEAVRSNTGAGNTSKAPDGPREVADDPHRLARLYVALRGTEEGQQALYCHRDEWYRWDSCSGYRPMPANEIRSEITHLVKREFDRIALAQWEIAKREADENDQIAPPVVRKVTGALVGNVLGALASESLLPGRIEPPAWIGDDEPPPWPADECVVTRSGIVHIPSVGTTENAVLPLTPTLFSTNVLPYGYDPDAKCDTWLSFLDSLWNDDPETIEALQEWFGYLLLPDTSQHKMPLLIGPPRSGKGTIARALRGMIGLQNLCAPTLASLAGPFGLWPLVGKLVALVADARLSGRTDAIAVVERLLSISGEDPQDVARKSMPTLAGVRLPVRFVLMSNELPSMRDASGALMTRVILLRLSRSFTGREDRTLGDRISKEMPGILNWSITGLQRLRKRGYFLQPESGRELLDDLADLSSPVSAFLEDACVLGPEYSVAAGDLFAAWRSWCDDHGRDHPGTVATFGRDLRAARPEIKVSNRRVLTTRQRYYEGIGTKGRLP
jgi:putative DNA primase/helicase